MKISKQYNISENNFYSEIFDKKQIILAGSGRADLNHIIHNNNKLDGKFKGWSTYTIDRDGVIYEHYNPQYYSDFMGDKEIDKKTISIMLANMGWLSYNIYTDIYYNWTGIEICKNEYVHEREWKQCKDWEQYPVKQVNSTINLCLYLCEKFDIELNTFAGNSQVQYIKEFEGVAMRSNYDRNYFDLNPSFDFKKLYKKIADKING